MTLSGNKDILQASPVSVLLEKEKELRRVLRLIGRTAIAFSGGADSSLLLKAAIDEMGADNVLVLTFRSCLHGVSETEHASSWPDRHGYSGQVRHICIDENPLKWDAFTANPADRCYVCKSSVYRKFIQEAEKQGFSCLVDGTNLDDMNSTRPGLKALRELGVRTPLAEAALSKDEVRKVSRYLSLDTWDYPSASCLATRIPTGKKITKNRLQTVSSCESKLAELGFFGCRFRLDFHDDSTGFIQVLHRDLDRILDTQIVETIKLILKDSGIEKVYIDTDGR